MFPVTATSLSSKSRLRDHGIFISVIKPYISYILTLHTGLYQVYVSWHTNFRNQTYYLKFVFIQRYVYIIYILCVRVMFILVTKPFM